MKRSAVLMLPMSASALLGLAACNSQPTVHAENATIAEVAAKAKNSVKVEPGQWTTKIELLSLDMPSLKDPAMLESMKGALKRSQATGVTHCVTKAQAEKPPEDFFAGKNAGQCKYDTFTMAGGRLNAVMTCKSPDGRGSMRMEMAGSFSSSAYDIMSNMKTSDAAVPGGAGMTMKAHVTASRTGECTGREDVKATPTKPG